MTYDYGFTDGRLTSANKDAVVRRFLGRHQLVGVATNLTMDEFDDVVSVTTDGVIDNTITLPPCNGNEGQEVSVFLAVDGGFDAVVTAAGTNTITNGSADLGNVTVTLDDAGDFVVLRCVTATQWAIVINVGGTVA